VGNIRDHPTLRPPLIPGKVRHVHVQSSVRLKIHHNCQGLPLPVLHILDVVKLFKGDRVSLGLPLSSRLLSFSRFLSLSFLQYFSTTALPGTCICGLNTPETLFHTTRNALIRSRREKLGDHIGSTIPSRCINPFFGLHHSLHT
jgi:hypothetical protein